MVLSNGSNYHLWKGNMKYLLFVKKLHLPMYSFAKTNFVSNKQWGLNIYMHVVLFDNMQKTVFIIILLTIYIKKTLWEKIESLYASKSGNNKLLLLDSFISLKYNEGTYISYHLSKFQGLFDQKSRMGIKFDDSLLW